MSFKTQRAPLHDGVYGGEEEKEEQEPEEQEGDAEEEEGVYATGIKQSQSREEQDMEAAFLDAMMEDDDLYAASDATAAGRGLSRAHTHPRV